MLAPRRRFTLAALPFALVMLCAAPGATESLRAPAHAAGSERSGCGDPHRSAALVQRFRGGRPPIGTAPCPGVRPGALIDADGGRCTANFLFRSSDGKRHIGTAGHCTLEANGEITYPPGKGPVVDGSDGKRIGEIAYAILGRDRDFALVRLDEDVKAKARMCFFGGPLSIYTRRSSDPVLLNYYGNDIGIGNLSAVNQSALPARSALAADTLDPELVFAYGVATQGDSGSGVVEESSDRALGALVGITSKGLMITRLPRQVASAERALGVDLRVRTAHQLFLVERRSGVNPFRQRHLSSCFDVLAPSVA